MFDISAIPWHIIGRILLSALLGGIVGLERIWSGHTAGLRTNMLIAISSCVFTILSIEAFPTPMGATPVTFHHWWLDMVESDVLILV